MYVVETTVTCVVETGFLRVLNRYIGKTMNIPSNGPGLQIREADGRDAAAILRLYRQLVQPVAPDVEVDVRAERITDYSHLPPRRKRPADTECAIGRSVVPVGNP